MSSSKDRRDGGLPARLRLGRRGIWAVRILLVLCHPPGHRQRPRL